MDNNEVKINYVDANSNNKRNRKRVNLPNKLTILRLILFIPFLLFLSLQRQFPFYGHSYQNVFLIISVIIFIIAMLTDWIDGFVARKTHSITYFGKMFDPIADKIIINTTLIFFAVFGYIYTFVPVLFIVRDVIVEGSRNIAASKNIDVSASIWGKIKTVFLSISIIIIFIIQLLPLGTNNIVVQSVNIIIYISLALSFISGFIYLWHVKSFLNLK